MRDGRELQVRGALVLSFHRLEEISWKQNIFLIAVIEIADAGFN